MARQRQLPEKEILSQIPAARAAGRRAAAEPRAHNASYDPRSGRVSVEFTNGCVFAFPAELAQGLAGAAPEDLLCVEVTPAGDGLHWERLDVDLLVRGLLLGVFGSKNWMREMGRRGGMSRSAAKSAAARGNGRKGGRPPVKRAASADAVPPSKGID